MQPTGEIDLSEWYEETPEIEGVYGYGCSMIQTTEDNTIRCYYLNIDYAKWQCERWPSCKYLYISGDLYFPRGDGPSVYAYGYWFLKLNGTLHCKYFIKELYSIKILTQKPGLEKHGYFN